MKLLAEHKVPYFYFFGSFLAQIVYFATHFFGRIFTYVLRAFIPPSMTSSATPMSPPLTSHSSQRQSFVKLKTQLLILLKSQNSRKESELIYLYIEGCKMSFRLQTLVTRCQSQTMVNRCQAQRNIYITRFNHIPSFLFL